MPEYLHDFGSLLEPVLAKISLELSIEQVSSLSRHYELLQRWNGRVNLTSIRAPQEIVERHFGEALYLAKVIGEAKNLVDVGSGAGFPGLPFAVARPDVRVTLVESIGKKATFLREVSRPLPNVSVYHGRVEDLQDSFEWLTMRAVAVRGVFPHLLRISKKLALLVSRGEVAGLEDERIVCEGTVGVPWGEQRVIWIGRASHRA
jgi:16S rRNA (guanine(527)-N(7))-methyltransferase RsmG